MGGTFSGLLWITTEEFCGLHVPRQVDAGVHSLIMLSALTSFRILHPSGNWEGDTEGSERA